MSGYSAPHEVFGTLLEATRLKASSRPGRLMILGILAGAYIGLGGELATVATQDLTQSLGAGLSGFIGGSVFSLGLILVVVAGGELFTGNILMVGGLVEGSVSWKGVARNWVIVYLCNFLGALLVASLIFLSGTWKSNGYAMGMKALSIGVGKISLPWGEAFVRGILCNWLVCLAVWLAYSGRDNISRMLGCYFPVMAFVASGFEHSIANMYFVPLSIFLRSTPAASILDISSLTWSAFLLRNLIPVTLGNIVGGALFVALPYWMAYSSRWRAGLPSPHKGTGVDTATPSSGSKIPT